MGAGAGVVVSSGVPVGMGVAVGSGVAVGAGVSFGFWPPRAQAARAATITTASRMLRTVAFLYFMMARMRSFVVPAPKPEWRDGRRARFSSIARSARA